MLALSFAAAISPCSLLFDYDAAEAETSHGSTEGQGLAVPRELVRRIKAITNVFEVGSPEADYSYIEDLGDGRGYTATQYGLCSNEPELARVIELHARSTPETQLMRYLPSLPPRGSGTDMKKLSGFVDAWQREARGRPSLAQACETVADDLYFTPAMSAAHDMQVASPVGQSIFYDTILQHGGGNDPDSFWSILDRAQDISDHPGPFSESRFLEAFLDVRRSVLMNPANVATTDVWRASVARVDALANLLKRNPALLLPILVESTDVRIALTWA